MTGAVSDDRYKRRAREITKSRPRAVATRRLRARGRTYICMTAVDDGDDLVAGDDHLSAIGVYVGWPVNRRS